MIHQYQLNGHNIVLDVGSGSVHVVDDLTYELLGQITDAKAPLSEALSLEFGAKYGQAQLAEAYGEIQALQEKGSLFASTDYTKYFDEMADSPIKAMCLHVAHDCNLRCGYCFASTGDFEGIRCIMNEETGKKAIDFLLEHSGKRRNLELDFFGGEPLMNMEVVRAVVAYARSKEAEHGKNFRFTITTNGVLLTPENIDFVNREMHNVVLSLDGRKEVNDRLRKKVGGQGSFDEIVPKFQEFVKVRGDKQYYLRGTFTKYNLDFAEDVKEMYRLGFRQLSMEPVVSDPADDYAITQADVAAISAEYERLANWVLKTNATGKNVNFFHFMLDLSGGPCAIKRLRGCGCGNEYVAITPEGDIYPCHQFVGQPEWKMGNLHEQTLNREMKTTFSQTSIYSRQGCSDCWAQFYCSGGCSANSAKYCGTLDKPFPISCDLEKKRVECAIMIQVESALAKTKAGA